MTLQVLGVPREDDVNKVDRAGREILQRVGICVQDKEFLDMLKDAGANVDFADNRVRFDGSGRRSSGDSKCHGQQRPLQTRLRP